MWWFASLFVLAEDDISSLLDSLPDVQQTEPEPEEEAPDDDPLDTTRSGMFAQYANQVRAEVLVAWKPNKKVIKKNPTLTTKLVVKVDDNGAFSGVTLLESSQNQKYDESALKAVRAVASTQPPPPEIAVQLEKGIVVEFSGRSRHTVK